MKVLVTRKGQVTIPIELRHKYGIEEGMKMTVEDSGSGMVLKVVPKLEDFVGNYSGKTISQEAINILDKMRSEDLY